ncbi:MAG: PAS domain-containing protein, partial [Thiohalorhabdaceae bacterium]
EEFQERLQDRQQGQGEVYEVTLNVAGAERTLWFHASPLPGPDGTPEGSLTLIEDVTEQRRAERDRDQQRQLLNQVLDALPVGVWVVDASGQFIRHNPAGETIWQGARYEGGQAAYAEYKGWWADTGEAIAPAEWAVARAVNHGETSLNEVIDIQCFDGSIRT